MEENLIMDVSGAWVRKDVGSAVQRMNAKADETERLFLSKHQGRLQSSLNSKTTTRHSKQKLPGQSR